MSTLLKTTKHTVIGLLSYLVMSISLSSIAMTIWVSNQPTENLTPQHLALAQQSIEMQLISLLIGFITTLIISYLLCVKTIKYGSKSITAFAVSLSVLSIIGLFWHPDYHVIHKIITLICPGLICWAIYKYVQAKKAI